MQAGTASNTRRAMALGVVAALVLTGLTVTGPRATADEPEDGTAPFEVTRLSGPDRIATAVAVSAASHDSAETAVLARADDFADALVAAPLAASVGGPILLTHSDEVPAEVLDELERLGTERVLIMGGVGAISDEALAPLSDIDVERIEGADRFATAAAVADQIGDAATVYVATGLDFPDALAVGPLAAADGSPVLLVSPEAIPDPTAAALDELAPESIVVLGGESAVGEPVAAALSDWAPVDRLDGATRWETAGAVRDAAVDRGADPDHVWLADGADFPDALVAGPAVAAAGGTLLIVDGDQLAAQDAAYTRLRERGTDLDRVALLGGASTITDDAEWQLRGVLTGDELPRGGRMLFPQHRMVALYGNARSEAMGALGEQPAPEAADRTIAAAEPFDTTDRTLLPTFELIATVATQAPGDDGLHRSVATDEEIQEYLDVARANDIYLVLDIQPGQSDFLTEVQRYEHFLREPDVGIALDPEWRMEPGQVPGDGVGTVDAAEVNQVVDYLAEIVREELGPQKLLIVHQFQTRMITNREEIRTPPELAVNIHMDGFGTREQKLDTYRILRADPPLTNGFKLFYQEDIDIFSPTEVLGLDPVPDFISYQ